MREIICTYGVADGRGHALGALGDAGVFGHDCVGLLSWLVVWKLGSEVIVVLILAVDNADGN